MIIFYASCSDLHVKEILVHHSQKSHLFNTGVLGAHTYKCILIAIRTMVHMIQNTPVARLPYCTETVNQERRVIINCRAILKWIMETSKLIWREYIQEKVSHELTVKIEAACDILD